MGRLQLRHARLRPGHDGRDRLDDRRRRPDARRRHRLPHARLRAVARQPALGRRRHRGRPVPHGEQGRERRPVLGAARWRRQLRRRDLARVPAAPGQRRLRRHLLLRTRPGGQPAALLPRVHHGRAGDLRRVPGVPGRAAAAVHPRGPARRHVLRRDRALDRPARGGRAGDGTVPRPRAAGRRDGRADALPGAQRGVRRPVPEGHAQLLEGQLRHRADRRGDRSST